MSRTLTASEYKRLITKSKQGWAAFYQSQTHAHNLFDCYLYKVKELEEKIKNRDAQLYEKDHIPDFVLNEITDMIKELKKEIECPICFTELKSEEIKFSSCGHKYCKTCLSKIKECAICRKIIYHKK